MKLPRHFPIMAAGAALVAVLLLWPRKATPTTAANRAAQLRADAFRGNLWRELANQPDFYM